MSYFTTENQKTDKKEYNDEQVYYCKDCLSLNIRHIKGIIGSEYCDNCGSTNILQTDIQSWEALYLQTYGELFVKHK